ncbi:MAG: DUF2004 domain-containing protein [Bacteroidota bacterium]
MKYQLPFFGEMDTTKVEEYYKTVIDRNGQDLRLDLNVKENQLATELFDQVKFLLETIDAQDVKNKGFIKDNYKDEEEETVRDYLNEHLEELEDELAEIVDFDNDQLPADLQLLRALKLVRIGFYPDGKYDSASFATYDYTIDEELTDQLIVVNVDKDGKLLDLAWES